MTRSNSCPGICLIHPSPSRFESKKTHLLPASKQRGFTRSMPTADAAPSWIALSQIYPDPQPRSKTRSPLNDVMPEEASQRRWSMSELEGCIPFMACLSGCVVCRIQIKNIQFQGKRLFCRLNNAMKICTYPLFHGWLRSAAWRVL